MKCFILIVAILNLSSCASKNYNNIRSLHLKGDFRPKVDQGIISKKDCKKKVKTKYGGYDEGLPSYTKAFNKLTRSNSGLTYLVDLNYKTETKEVTDKKGKNSATETCLVVEAQGYR